MLPTCGPSDIVYRAYGGSDGVSRGFGGGSPAEACTTFAAGSGNAVGSISDHMCSLVGVSAVYPIYKLCEPPVTMSTTSVAEQTIVVNTDPFTAERMETDMWMFGAMLGYLTLVWGSIQLKKLFSTGRYES